MSQIPPDPDPEVDPPDPAVEEESRRQRAARERETRDLKLENAMLRLGIKKEGYGKLFFDSYAGELTDEAIKASAEEYHLMDPPPAEGAPPGEITDPLERQQTLDRQQASGGAAPDGETPSEDPRVTAIKRGEEMLALGASQEAAMGAAFDTIASAGYGSAQDGRAPDPRAQFDPDKVDPRRPDLGW